LRYGSGIRSGERKLAVLLSREGIDVPRMTVYRMLERRGMLHPLDQHSKATGSFQRDAPNQLGQMDFKGPKGWGTHLGPLSVIDDHSRYAVVLEQLRSGRGEHMRERLEGRSRTAACPKP
jgi:transposase InsO family protein